MKKWHPTKRRGCRPAPDLLPVYWKLRERFPQWAQKELPERVIIVWNIGLTSRGGTCWWMRKQGRLWRWIEISSLFSRESAEKTLLHEMVHYALPRNVMHGKEFWALAEAVGVDRKCVPNEEWAAARQRKFSRRTR